MMGYVGKLVMAGGGDIPGSLRDERKCWDRSKLIFGDAEGGAGAGPGY